MLKTTELTGAHLDYWTARAEGIPAEQLTIRRVQRSTDCHCVRLRPTYPTCKAPWEAVAVRYSTDWAQGGPLIERHEIELCPNGGNWVAYIAGVTGDVGDTPLQAICRAVVRAAFGDEVEEEEVAVCE